MSNIAVMTSLESQKLHPAKKDYNHTSADRKLEIAKGAVPYEIW